MEFWSTVTFRASDDKEEANLRAVIRAVSELNPTVAQSVTAVVGVVVEPEHARALAEALQRAKLDGPRDRIRRGLIKALAFNQHYVHGPDDWVPMDVVRRHHRQ